jgi:hypothetical protein
MATDLWDALTLVDTLFHSPFAGGKNDIWIS